MEWGKLPLFLKKNVFFKENFKVRYLSQLISYWYQIETSQNKRVSSVERFFYLFLILKIRLATKSKVRKQVFLRKRVCFQNFGASVILLNSTLKSPYRKKYKKNKNWKMNFWPIFILFYFLFFYFFLKTFLFLRYLKKQLQILKDRSNTYSKVSTNLS